LLPPAWMEGGSWSYPLGTDALGRDILSRLIYGARFSLFIGVVVVTLSVSVGVVVGLIAGFFRGWVDTAIMRVMDVILAFPSLLLALVLVAILGPGPDERDDRHRADPAAAFRAVDPRLGAVGTRTRICHLGAGRRRQRQADVHDHPAELHRRR
jgi:ABC-type dipeptide/oligopeptide/nickel transport system permease subunit